MTTSINFSKPIAPLNPELANNRVVGSGISFPFEFSTTGKTRSISLSTGVEKINQSMHMILTTRKGERVMMPEYGSNLPLLVYEPNDAFLEVQLREETATALARWEPRIKVLRVDIVSPFQDEIGQMIRMGAPSNIASIMANKDWVGIVIFYVIARTHQQGSYVFPFEVNGIPMANTVQSNRIAIQR